MKRKQNKWKDVRKLRKFIMDHALNEKEFELYKLKNLIKETELKMRLVTIHGNTYLSGMDRHSRGVAVTKNMTTKMHGAFFTRKVLDYRTPEDEDDVWLPSPSQRIIKHVARHVTRKQYQFYHPRISRLSIAHINVLVNRTKCKINYASMEQRDISICILKNSSCDIPGYDHKEFLIAYDRDHLVSTDYSRYNRILDSEPTSMVRRYQPNYIQIKNKFYAYVCSKENVPSFFSRTIRRTGAEVEAHERFKRLPRASKEFEWEMFGGL